jgi:hypothetical protein
MKKPNDTVRLFLLLRTKQYLNNYGMMLLLAEFEPVLFYSALTFGFSLKPLRRYIDINFRDEKVSNFNDFQKLFFKTGFLNIELTQTPEEVFIVKTLNF